MLRCFGLLAFLIPLATAPAQDAHALIEREQKLVARAVAALHALADAYVAQKQHARALQLRRTIWQDYAEHDEPSRSKCGFVRVGNAWRMDASKLVIDKNLTGDQKLIKKIDQDCAKLDKELLAEHRALAEGWSKAGDASRAMGHWRRVLVFAPGDRTAAEALSMASFEDFAGSPMELGMLRRARTIRGAIDWLVRKQFEVQEIKGAQHPVLQKAGVGHRGFRTEHFEVWGTLPDAQLTLAAQFAERALLFSATLMGTSEGGPFVPARVRNLLFVGDDAAYGRALDACAEQFDAARLEFLKKDVDLAFLNVGADSVRLVKNKRGEPELLDQTVRGVLQDASGVFTNGLWEGLGHAVCNYFFGRTLSFLLEQVQANTVAGSAPKPLLPDMATWAQIAEQSAWGKSDTATSQLVLINASRFSNEQRVKAWAMVDYLLLWRPELLRQLDQSQSDEIRLPPDVEKEFTKKTQLSLPAIDAQWRDYWGRGELLRKAMAADPLGDPKSKERSVRESSRAIVDAVNEVRAAAWRGPVGFHFATDAPTLAALQYASDLVKAETENAKKPKVPVPMPTAPATIGRTLLWSRAEKPGDAVAVWMSRPSWRDSLLHPGRGLFGARAGRHALALDLTDRMQPTTQGLPLCWPRDKQKKVPGSAVVQDLGPRAVAALTAAGKQATDVVGMPLTLHFAREMSGQDLLVVEPTVYCGNQRVRGVLVRYQGEGPDDDTAPGLVAFVPLEPLPAGTDVEVRWTVPASLLKKNETFPALMFSVK